MRKFDQYKGVSDIISKVRQMAAASPLKHIKDEMNNETNWAATDFESDPLGRLLRYLPELSTQLKQDLSKVEFDWENYDSGTDLVDIAWYGEKDNIFGYSKSIMGPHNQLGSAGVSWIGCAAGGDWEIPVFFMLYMDQGEVRAWIPKEGNCWNRTTKQAFGNDEDADDKDSWKQLEKLDPDDAKVSKECGCHSMDFEYKLRNSDIIRQSIQDHFEPRPREPLKHK